MFKLPRKNIFTFSILLFIIFSSYCPADSYHSDLQQEVDSMLNYADNYLMTRSKKDAEHGHISRDAREAVKKIRNRAQWLKERITWHVAEKHDQRTVRDDFEQEQQFKEMKKLVEEVMDMSQDNPRADKFLEMCDTFLERYIEELSYLLGYRREHHRRRD